VSSLERLRYRTGDAGEALQRFAGVIASCILLAVFVLPIPVYAQQRVESSLSVGAVRVRYGDAINLSAITLSPTTSWVSPRHSLQAHAVLSQPIEGIGSSQGVLMGRWNTSATAPLIAEFAGTAGGSRTGDGASTGQVQGTLRGLWRGHMRGAFAGGGVGRVWDGETWRATRVTEIGGWTLLGATFLSLSHTPTVAEDTIRYADTQLGLGWDGARLSLDAVLGHRQGTARLTGVDDPGAWANLTATYRIAERQQLMVSTGSYPLDLLQGFPAGRYTSIGLRFGGGRRASSNDAGHTQRPRAGAVEIVPLAQGRYRILLRAPTAARVELQGSLTGWIPIAMRAMEDGWWEIELSADPGVYELVYRRDGGAWEIPASLSTRRDEFGGAVGLLLLP
jgi:hypothetical protein